MNNKTVSAGQFFTLLFVGRISLTLLYSSTVSGITDAVSFILPFIIFIPLSVILCLPSAADLPNGKGSLCSYAARELGVFGKGICILYGVYFLFSAFCSVALFREFISEALPFGANSMLLLIAVVSGCAFAAVRGIEAVSRLSLPVLMLVILCFVLMFMFLSRGFSSEKLDPQAMLSFSSAADCLVFLVSRMNGIAAVNALSHHIKGNIKRGAVMFCVFYSLAACAAVTLFSGSAGDYLSVQHLQSFKAIDGSGVLQRLAPLFILSAVCSLFCNVSLCLIAASKSISLASSRFSAGKAALTVSVMVIGGVLFLPDEAIRGIVSSTVLSAAAAVLFIFLLPLCLRIYRAGKLKKKKAAGIFPKKHAGRFMLLLLLIPLMLSLCGCSTPQLDERLIVQGIGIDKETDSYKLTVIALDTKDPEQENKSTVIYSQGGSAENALLQLEEQRGKRLLMSHCRFIMMNEKAAEDCVSWISGLTDKYGTAKNAGVMISKGSSKGLLSAAVKELGYSTEDIAVITDSRAVEQGVRNVTLFELISAINSQEEAMMLPLVISDKDTRSLRAEETEVRLLYHS